MPAATSHLPLLTRSSAEKKAAPAARIAAVAAAEDAEVTAADDGTSAAGHLTAAAAVSDIAAKEVSAASTRLRTVKSAARSGEGIAASLDVFEFERRLSSSTCCETTSESHSVTAGVATATAELVGAQEPEAGEGIAPTADTFPLSKATRAAEVARAKTATGLSRETSAAVGRGVRIPEMGFAFPRAAATSAAEYEETTSKAATGTRPTDVYAETGKPAEAMQSFRAARETDGWALETLPTAEGKRDHLETVRLRETASVLLEVNVTGGVEKSSLTALVEEPAAAAGGNLRAASSRRRSGAIEVEEHFPVYAREHAAAAEKETGKTERARNAAAARDGETTDAEAEELLGDPIGKEKDAGGPSEQLSPFLDASLREKLERRGMIPCSLADVLRRRKKQWARTQLISPEVQPEKERLDALFKRQCEGWGNNQEGWIHGRWCSVIFCPDFRQGGLQVSRTGRRKLWERLKQTVEGWVDPCMQICEVLDSTHPVRFATPPGQSCYTVVYVGEPIPANKQSRVVFGEYTGAVLKNSSARKSFEYVFDLSFCALAWRKAEEFETASDSSDDEVAFSGVHASCEDAAPATGSAGDLQQHGELEAAAAQQQQQHTREKKKQLVAASGRKDSRGLTRVQLPARSEFVLDSSSCCNELSLVNHYGTIELLGDRVERRNAEWQQVFVDGWPHIVLTSIPGVAVQPGDELLADFGNEWFHKVQDAAHAQIARELLRYRLRLQPDHPQEVAEAAATPRLFPDRPFSCIDRRADLSLRSRARQGEICPYCHCDELPQQQEDEEQESQFPEQQQRRQAHSPQQRRQAHSPQQLLQQQEERKQQREEKQQQEDKKQQQHEEKKQQQEEEKQHQQLFGDEVVHCDGCDRPCHLRCLPDGAATLNEWKWYCAICRMQFFEMARNMDYQILVPAREAHAAAGGGQSRLPFDEDHDCCNNDSVAGRGAPAAAATRGARAAAADVVGGIGTVGMSLTAAAAKGSASATAAAGDAPGGAEISAAEEGSPGNRRYCGVVRQLQQQQQDLIRESGGSCTGSTTTPSLQEEEAAEPATALPQETYEETAVQQHDAEQQPQTGRGTEIAGSFARQLQDSMKKPFVMTLAAPGGSCSNRSSINGTATRDAMSPAEHQQQQHLRNRPPTRCSPRLLQQQQQLTVMTCRGSRQGNCMSSISPAATAKERKRVAAAGQKTEVCAVAVHQSRRLQQQTTTSKHAAGAAAATLNSTRMHRDAGDRGSKTGTQQQRNIKADETFRAADSSCNSVATADHFSAVNASQLKTSRSPEEEGEDLFRDGEDSHIFAEQQQYEQISHETEVKREGAPLSGTAAAASKNTKRGYEEQNSEAAVMASAARLVASAAESAAASPRRGSGNGSCRESAGGDKVTAGAAAATEGSGFAASRVSAATELAKLSSAKAGTAAEEAAAAQPTPTASEESLHGARHRELVTLTDAEATFLSWNRFALPPPNISETRRVCASANACATAGRMQASRAGLVGLHSAELQGLQSHVPMPPRFLLNSLRPCMQCHRLLGARASTEVCRLARRHLAPSWDHPHQAASPVLLREAILTAFQEKLTSLQREMKSRMHALQKELRKAKAAAASGSPAAGFHAVGAAGFEGAEEQRGDRNNGNRVGSSNSYGGQFLTAAAADYLSFTLKKFDHTAHSDVWNSSSLWSSYTPSNSSSCSRKSSSRLESSAQKNLSSCAGTAGRPASPARCCSPVLQQHWKKKKTGSCLTISTSLLPSFAAAAASSPAVQNENLRSPPAAAAKAGRKISSSHLDAATAAGGGANGQMLEHLLHVPPMQKSGFVPLLGIYLGKTYIDRHFEQGWFSGRVMDFSPLTIEEDGRWFSNLFRVEYEDGDEEFFGAEDLLELLATHAVRRWETSNNETEDSSSNGNTPAGAKHFYKTTTLDRLLAPGLKAARLELNARVRRLRMLEEPEETDGIVAAAGKVLFTENEEEKLKKRRREDSTKGSKETTR